MKNNNNKKQRSNRSARAHLKSERLKKNQIQRRRQRKKTKKKIECLNGVNHDAKDKLNSTKNLMKNNEMLRMIEEKNESLDRTSTMWTTDRSQLDSKNLMQKRTYKSSLFLGDRS